MSSRLDSVIEDLRNRKISIQHTELIRASDASTIRNDVYSLTDDKGRKYFLKIGRWEAPRDDRCLWHEVEAYGRLISRYPDDVNKHYAGLVTASELHIDDEEDDVDPLRPVKKRRFKSKKKQSVGYILLNYIDLKKWKDPNESDVDLIVRAIQYLEKAGIVHLDITQNVLVHDNDFFWMDFEAVVIEEEDDDASYKEIYKKSIKDIAKLVSKHTLIPTPEIKHKSKSKIYTNDFLDDVEDHTSKPSVQKKFYFDDVDDNDNEDRPYHKQLHFDDLEDKPVSPKKHFYFDDVDDNDNEDRPYHKQLHFDDLEDKPVSAKKPSVQKKFYFDDV